eukprot:7350983-Prymnesium_polylepis.2
MSGDEMTELAACGGGFNGRWIQVHRGARLSLHGKRPATLWSKLVATAIAGDWAITVGGHVDWVEGDELLIAGTGDSEQGTEHVMVAGTRSIAAINGKWREPHSKMIRPGARRAQETTAQASPGCA